MNIHCTSVHTVYLQYIYISEVSLFPSLIELKASVSCLAHDFNPSGYSGFLA